MSAASFHGHMLQVGRRLTRHGDAFMAMCVRRRVHHQTNPERAADVITPDRRHVDDHLKDMSSHSQRKPKVELTIAEQDAALMQRLQDREGSLANAQFENGKLEEGYRRNVKANIFRYI